MPRHGQQTFLIDGKIVEQGNSPEETRVRPPTAIEQMRVSHFTQMLPGVGVRHKPEHLLALAQKMMEQTPTQLGANSHIPAGFTYLGQFVDHDLTFDKTEGVTLTDQITIEQLLQGRSPLLDLDCLYGSGPKENPQFYRDSIRLLVGSTQRVNFPPNLATADKDYAEHDLPRKANSPEAIIADPRNDENLIVAQVHLAFLRFHNAVVDMLERTGGGVNLFERARESVTKHYQWIIRHEFLPLIVDKGILEEVFTRGRRFFDAHETVDIFPQMPVEFSVAAYRLGHSMIRKRYNWNAAFATGKAGNDGKSATLDQLFQFTGASGAMIGDFRVLPSNWVADWRQFFDFRGAGFPELAPKVTPQINMAQPLDTLLVDPLADLNDRIIRDPSNVVGKRNLAFRNLMRGRMVSLASGQQMANFFGVPALERQEILLGRADHGVNLSTLSAEAQNAIAENTPLWFYILREAEVKGNGRLGAVGSRIVVETFHRAMEASRHSILRDANFRPNLGPDERTFRMVDLLRVAFKKEGKTLLEELAPLGDG